MWATLACCNDQCRMWGACPSLARAAPCMLAAWGQRCSVSSPSGLALAARTTVALLNLKVQSFEEPPQRKRGVVSGRVALVKHNVYRQLQVNRQDRCNILRVGA